MSSRKEQPEEINADDEQVQAGQAPPGEVLELRKERDDLLARLQRVSADFLNYQKRSQREIAQSREYANESLIKPLLGVLDDMERALEAAVANHPPDDPLLVGMRLVYDKAMDVLSRFGLTAIDAEGRPFDPELHSALIQEESQEYPPRTVLRQLQRGYRLKGRTIRPASVVVSKGPEEENRKPAGGEEDVE